MSNPWKTYAIVSAVTVTALGVLIWIKKKKTYVKVGKISKLFFYPVKSLKGIEVPQGKCTQLGFEVDGVLDRSFMLIRKGNVLLSQREAPRLQLLTPHICGNLLLITGPDVLTLKLEIKTTLSESDKVIECKVHTDKVNAVDVGDEAASWFQNYLNMPDVRMVHFIPELPARVYTRKDPYYAQMRKDNPVSFQDLTALHLLSVASIEDLNSKIEGKKVSLFNFRPTVLIEECKPFAEDAWELIKFKSGAEALLIALTTRCLMTTNDPDNAVLSQKEPLVTLRKYRIPKDREVLKKTGALPCLGTHCAVLKPGEIKVGDEIFAIVGKQPSMVQKI